VQAAKRSFLPFKEARALVREVGLGSQKEWLEWCRDAPRPSNVPSNPQRTYKDKGWVSWADWLGYGEGEPKSNEFLPFEKAREIVRAVGMESWEWPQWSKECRPADIPSAPDATYADEGWVSWPDWLGYGEGRVAKDRTPKSFLPFEEARELVRNVGLGSQEQWWEWCRDAPRPANMPFNPNVTYAGKGWVSWADWLGYGVGEPRSNEFLPFEDARDLVRAVGLKRTYQWWEWSRDCRPADIPSRPDLTYADEGWVSYPDWLGYGKDT
jgi:hypothetical protein